MTILTMNIRPKTLLTIAIFCKALTGGTEPPDNDVEVRRTTSLTSTTVSTYCLLNYYILGLAEAGNGAVSRLTC